VAPSCQNCVLLVDDDSSIRGIVARQLAKAGFDAIHAEDGLDAVMKLRETLPRVIISDMQMPRMLGLEFIGVVRWRFPTIPVIAFSGAPFREFPEYLQPDRCFNKNIPMLSELVQAVCELAQKTSHHISLPIRPIRVHPNGSSYIDLTCPECLRSFEWATRKIKKQTPEQTAVCFHCQARVPFLIEGSALQ
jgi:CheY-like chemotaxis protein